MRTAYFLLFILAILCFMESCVANNGSEEIREITGIEYCYKGFVYLYTGAHAGYIPVFNPYGSPLRCPKKVKKK